MGDRGPLPNKDSDLARSRSRKGAEAQPAATMGVLRDVTIPDPDPEWGPVAHMLYESIKTSGIADFYQDSDWAFAFFVISEIDVYRRKGVNKETGEEYPTHRPSGQMFAALAGAMTALGLTEGDRRRMRIELEKPKEEHDAQLYAIDSYKADLDD